MQNVGTGKPSHSQRAQTLPGLRAIVQSLNQVDSGIAALMELLQGSTGKVSAEKLAALIRPHADLLKRVSADLNDHT